MTRKGSSVRMRSQARLRSSGLLKSHRTPSTSAWRSKVEPATRPLPTGKACVTRGGEYSSTTRGPGAVVLAMSGALLAEAVGALL